MVTVDIHICPETGICSILKDGGGKVDLMPGEAQAIRDAVGDAAKIRDIISECDSDFAEALDTEDVASIAARVK